MAICLAIWGIVGNFLGPTIELGKCIAEPIKRQFNYLCCFNSNIQNLNDESEKLKGARSGLEDRITRAMNNGEVNVVQDVEAWLRHADEIQDSARGIQHQIPNVQSGCFTITTRFSVSKKAKKISEAMKELRDSCKFDHVSHPIPAAATAPIPLGSMHEFQSRKEIEEGIMATLRDKNVSMMGICGMGGVGKTTMAKKIMNRVKDEKLLDETAMVVVSQQVDKLRIQIGIAEYLGFKNLKDLETLEVRAHELRARLTGIKRTLIVIDDIWEQLKLEELGIPSGNSKCTILLTSRDKEVLTQMEAQVFTMKILHEEEAWSLFKDKAKIYTDEPDLLSIAKGVAKECQGLPVALETVGSALRDEKNIATWKVALRKFKVSDWKSVPTIYKEVYLPLRLSYDFLSNSYEKSIFLLCCQFPEDFGIEIEYLTFYSMGLRMFEEISNLQETRENLSEVVKVLKSRFLLLDCEDEGEVKVHDVIRDVGISIASEEGLVLKSRGQSSSDCKWLLEFPKNNGEIPTGTHFPSLCLFAIHMFGAWGERLEINDLSVLQGMKELNVLSLGDISIRLLPQTMQHLENLRTLHLRNCALPKTIPVVGELSNLEILICALCDGVEELPIEIGRLTHLKLLDFSGCRSLTRIAPGVVSNLLELEELKMRGSFKGWESAEPVEGKERRNASVKELESLSKLKCLEIEIEDRTLVAEEIRLPSTIEKYFIDVGRAFIWGPASCDKFVALNIANEIKLGNWIRTLTRSTERLELAGECSNNFDLSEVNDNIKHLGISNCERTKNPENVARLIDRRKSGSFPVLESFILLALPRLEEIVDGPIPKEYNAFKNLKQLVVGHLPALKHLWNPANQQVVFSSLRRLHIFRCEQLKKVIVGEENASENWPFPKLEVLQLYYLPQLERFCEWKCSIELLELREVIIKDCPLMKSFSMGFLHTPKLKKIEIDYGRVDHVGDLNGAVSLHLSQNNPMSTAEAHK